MTIDEAISLLKQYIDYNNPDIPDFYTMAEACEVVIKALEQEPFINKPCVSEKMCEQEKQMVLDKIRSEIDSHCSDNRDRNDGLYIAMRIIDKYQASPTGAEGSDKE